MAGTKTEVSFKNEIQEEKRNPGKTRRWERVAETREREEGGGQIPRQMATNLSRGIHFILQGKTKRKPAAFLRFFLVKRGVFPLKQKMKIKALLTHHVCHPSLFFKSNFLSLSFLLHQSCLSVSRLDGREMGRNGLHHQGSLLFSIFYCWCCICLPSLSLLLFLSWWWINQLNYAVRWTRQ